METTTNAAGRIVVPEQLREALGPEAGRRVDISLYGAGLQVVPAGRTARLVEEGGRLVARSDTPVTDEVVRLIGEDRR